MKKCEIPDIIIGLAITIGEIINGRGEKRGLENYFTWAAWKIDVEILNLLSGRPYCEQPPQRRFLDRLVGGHLAPHQDSEESAARYFHCVFEYEFGKRVRGETPSIIPLQETIRSHCLDGHKQQEKNLFPASIWRVFTRAGETEGKTAVYYRYFCGDELDTLKHHLTAVINSANRHYAELYRLGLYPPDHIGHIKVSQARQLNGLLAAARTLAARHGGTWQSHLPAAWITNPMTKIGDDKCPDYATFVRHDIIKSILGLRPPLRFLSYDEESPYEDAEEAADYDEPDTGRDGLVDDDDDDDDSFITEYRANLELLKKRLARATYLHRRDRELLFALLHRRDLGHLIREAEEERVLAHMETLLRRLFATP